MSTRSMRRVSAARATCGKSRGMPSAPSTMRSRADGSWWVFPRFELFHAGPTFWRLGRRSVDILGFGPSMLEAIDLALGVCDRRIRIGPGEADFQRLKRIAADDDRFSVRAADPRVP